MTYDEIMALKIEYVSTEIVAEGYPAGGKKLPKPPRGLPAYLRHLYSVPLLTTEQEIYLFQRMNYVKFLAASLRDGLRPHHNAKIAAINAHLSEALRLRNLIIESNLRLVVNTVKPFCIYNPNLDDWISDGNIALLRAVEKFDYRKGNKFSTYATYAIRNKCLSVLSFKRRHTTRYPMEDKDLSYVAEKGKEDNGCQDQEVVTSLMTLLTEREKAMIEARFGFNGQSCQLLQEIGDQYGITKERARQILKLALRKIGPENGRSEKRRLA